MTISLMVYGGVIGLLLGAAAYLADRSLRALGRPTRWIWMGAMAGTALAPFLSLVRPGGRVFGEAVGRAIPLDALYEMGGIGPSGVPGVSRFLFLLDRPLLLLWVVASALILILFVGGAYRLHRKATRWAHHSAGGEEVLVSDGIGPAVLGLLYPRIVLPPWVLSLGRDELEMVLLHEGEHRRARDPAFLAGGILLVALAPWNPALWWGLQRMRLAVEGDCDGRVLARGIRRDRYGSFLLGVASGSPGIFPLVPALAEGGGTILERRLQMMKSNVGTKGWRGAVLGVAAGGFLLALACETPTPPQLAAEEGLKLVALEASAEHASISVLPEGPTISGDTIVLKAPVGLRVNGSAGEQTSQPLIFVDGELKGRGKEVLDGINPDNIDRIEIMKGAAAAAIYGEDAADGVIQIFLKK